MVVGFCGILLFLFVPESFWDRTPTKTHHPSKNHSSHSLFLPSNQRSTSKGKGVGLADSAVEKEKKAAGSGSSEPSLEMPSLIHHHTSPRHVDFAPVVSDTIPENVPEGAKVEDADNSESRSPLASAVVSPLETKSPGKLTCTCLESC